MLRLFITFFTCITTSSFANPAKVIDISHLISQEKFKSYQNVADFIDDSPKVTIAVPSSKEDIAEYGAGLITSHTGSDCDRDGIMDDNARCNAVYLKLWLKYSR